MEILTLYYVLDEYTRPREHDGPQLELEDKRKRDKRYPRISVRRFAECPFLYLFKSGNEQALLNCCAVDHRSFRELLELFQPVYDQWTVDKDTDAIRKRKQGGRPRELCALGALGLVLFWYRTRGSCARCIALPFGLTATPMYKWLKFSRKVLLSVLQDHPAARVLPPSNEEVDRFADAIADKYPVLRPRRVWGAVDGLKLEMEQSGNWAAQNPFYNSWCQGTFVNSIFVFSADGKIRMAVINAPGSLHDSTVADFGIYDKMEAVFDETGGRIVVDSAFNIKEKDYLIKSSQHFDHGATTVHRYRENEAATSVRQLSEHGMRMLQGQFPRMKDKLAFGSIDSVERRICLQLLVLLYNYQTSKVGINQILNTFMSKTEGFDSYAFTANGELASIDDTADSLFINPSE